MHSLVNFLVFHSQFPFLPLRHSFRGKQPHLNKITSPARVLYRVFTELMLHRPLIAGSSSRGIFVSMCLAFSPPLGRATLVNMYELFLYCSKLSWNPPQWDWANNRSEAYPLRARLFLDGIQSVFSPILLFYCRL